MSKDAPWGVEQIREFWTRQALEHGTDVAASWSDKNAVELEIETISARLVDGQRVLDIGCANGYSTIRFAAARELHLRGIDYIPEMIAEARRAYAQVRESLRSEVEFAVGDIVSLSEPDAAFDTVVVVRVIINLHDWTRQRAALGECARVLRPGGTLLLSEATVQGWQRLNLLRHEWGLPDIPMPPFNRYLDQEAVIAAVSNDLELVEIVNFASTYFVGTRVLKPLLIKALGLGIDAADPGMEWNRWFRTLPAGGDYGTQKLFIFRKR
jgi:SAM-dependent methyltransferase